MFIFSDVQLQGYIHSLSPIKGQKAPFFDFIFQTSDEEKKRGICYEPGKRPTLHQAYSQKSPVKISKLKRLPSSSFSSNTEDFKITKKSKIMPTTTDFSYNPEIASSLVTVKQALSADLYKSVDVVAKVMSKQQEKQLIISNGKQLMKVDCMIADTTDTIKLVLWEDLIDKVDCGKSYLFQAVKIRVFDDAKYLSTNESTIITAYADIKDVNLTSQDIKDNIIEGQCIGVNLKKTTSCIVCNNTLVIEADKETVKCRSCNTTMLSEACNKKIVCILTIKTAKKLQSYTCFNDALQSFLASIGDNSKVEDLTIEDLQGLILRAGKKSMIVDNSSHVLYQFLL